MANALTDLSVEQLKRAVEIKQEIESLQAELAGLTGEGPARRRGRPPGSGRRKLSPAAREAIASAQRARWARQKGKAGAAATGAPRRRRMSAAGRARIAAAARARWAKAKAAGKNKL